jgi:RNA-directed DNA polymerase
MPNRAFYSALARSILAGETALEPIVARARSTLGRNWRWLRPMARRFLLAFSSEQRPRHKAVISFLQADEGLRSAFHHYGTQVRTANWLRAPDHMQPVHAARRWQIPAIETVGELASWLQITPNELEWFANLKRRRADAGRDGHSGPLSHYHYRILAKDGGSVRLIEAPKRKLKGIQAKILSEVLEAIPVHAAVHGFRRGHSIKTFAAPHVGQRVVLRMDLHDFFPSLSGARVQAVFRTAGYPEPVAHMLGCLCTNAAPRSVFARTDSSLDRLAMIEAGHIYERPHLTQGAPTSPALANICAYRVDCRLTGLAKAAGAVYTRYADDLAFSGGEAFEHCVERFAHHAAAILLEEGFRVHYRKTRIMRRGVRQYLAGLVVNQHINVPRADVDRLKATLTNCVRFGPESQNREGHPAFRMHLDGRVGFVEMVTPARGARLREIFEQIQW